MLVVEEKYFFFLLAMLYAGVSVTGRWLLMQAEKRQRWRSRFGGVIAARWSRIEAQIRGVVSQTSRLLTKIWSSARSASGEIHRCRGHAAVIFALLAFPPLLAFFFSSQSVLDGYPDTKESSDPVVAALLHGEQLVPPPPPPPDVFLSKDLELSGREIGGASREWSLLDSEFRQRLLTVFQLMAGHGYQMVLIEGYRSPERQAQLAQLGPHVTNAGAYQSYHQYGLAADSAFFRNGKIVISERDSWAMEGYRLYGKYAESVGLVWGGKWQMLDLGHVELKKASLQVHH